MGAKQVITLTEAAAGRIREVAGDGALRLGVTGGGCAGFTYTMDVAEAPAPGDEVVEDKGAKVFIDSKSLLYLVGTELDFVEETFGAHFTFRNPNQTASCGCGESVALKQAE